jgi:uncharacterized protein YecE (DUF72 family)
VSWFTAKPEIFLKTLGVGRVAADPSSVPQAAEPGGDLQQIYLRWHGSPEMYYSEYPLSALEQLAIRVIAADAVVHEVWCIFDNTALGAAQKNAVELLAMVKQRSGG